MLLRCPGVLETGRIGHSRELGLFSTCSDAKPPRFHHVLYTLVNNASQLCVAVAFVWHIADVTIFPWNRILR